MPSRPTVTLHLGKTDHVHDPRDLLMARYTAALGVPAGPLGHRELIPADGWGMLGNGPDPSVSPDFAGAGDCVFAGGDHEVMLWNAERGKAVTFTGADSIADYSAVTGYNGTPATDRGTDMRTAMLYRKSTGLRDSAGKRHKITAFAALAAGDLNQVKQAIWLFSVAAVGIQFPSYAMDQFNAGLPWSVRRSGSIEGGHYVPVVGYDPTADLFFCVTWGRLQPVTPGFLAKYMDEGYAPLSSEARKHGRTLEGFDYRQLKADLTAINPGG